MHQMTFSRAPSPGLDKTQEQKPGCLGSEGYKPGPALRGPARWTAAGLYPQGTAHHLCCLLVLGAGQQMQPTAQGRGPAGRGHEEGHLEPLGSRLPQVCPRC